MPLPAISCRTKARPEPFGTGTPIWLAERVVNITPQIAREDKRLLPTFPVGSPKNSGKRDVVDIVDLVEVRRASSSAATATRAPKESAPAREPALTPLTSIDIGDWRGLSERAIEPNGYYLPDW